MLWFVLLSSLPLYADNFNIILNNQLPLRSNYELDVLTLALETTKSEYGDFTIKTMESGYTISRQIKVAQESPDIILWASPYHSINTSLTIIEYPLFNGIFGLRGIVLHKSKLNDFNRVKNVDDLRKYTIAQGPGWMDVSIYKNSGFIVFEARLKKLFNMASQQRFDLLPLGIIEIDDETLKSKKGGNDLIIAPNHMIYYPHPVLFHLNQKHTKAISRLNDGMQEITRNGSLAALFEQRFPHVTAKLKQPGMTVISIENNFLPGRYLRATKGSAILHNLNIVEQ